METFVVLLVLVLLIAFSKPLFQIAMGVMSLILAGVVLTFLFMLLKVLLFGR